MACRRWNTARAAPLQHRGNFNVHTAEGKYVLVRFVQPILSKPQELFETLCTPPPPCSFPRMIRGERRGTSVCLLHAYLSRRGLPPHISSMTNAGTEQMATGARPSCRHSLPPRLPPLPACPPRWLSAATRVSLSFPLPPSPRATTTPAAGRPCSDVHTWRTYRRPSSFHSHGLPRVEVVLSCQTTAVSLRFTGKKRKS